MEGRRVELLQEVGPKPVESVMAPKEDLRVELGSDNQELLNEIAQQSQLLLPSHYSRASPLKATPDIQPSSCQWYPEAMHNAILKNQEALRMVLTNQDMLKNLVDQLQNTMSSIEDRVQAIEQEMSIFAQFSKEIDQLGDETNLNEIAFYP
ncbi:hypothetical protein L345_12659, partial [Ophiophagus hannah]